MKCLHRAIDDLKNAQIDMVVFDLETSPISKELWAAFKETWDKHFKDLSIPAVHKNADVHSSIANSFGISRQAAKNISFGMHGLIGTSQRQIPKE